MTEDFDFAAFDTELAEPEPPPSPPFTGTMSPEEIAAYIEASVKPAEIRW